MIKFLINTFCKCTLYYVVILNVKKKCGIILVGERYRSIIRGKMAYNGVFVALVCCTDRPRKFSG